MAKKSTTVLLAQDLRAKKNVKSMKRKVKDSEIDFTDMPELTSAKLSKFKKRGRPVIGDSLREPIYIRIEKDVLAKLKTKAAKTGVGYQSLINEILKKAI